MSLALKRQQFRTEIRRENLKKILKDKKEKYYLEKEVNQTLEEYLHQKNNETLPKICSLKFQYLTQHSQATLVTLIKSKEITLDFSKPQHISLVNKISLKEECVLQQFFYPILAFAQKMIFALKGNENNCFFNQQNSFPHLNQSLLQDLILFPNCLLQFWAQFFATQYKQIKINSYCGILRSFIYWFGSKSNFFKHFSKYSICFFMNNFMKFENIFSLETNSMAFKQVEDLHINFQIVSMQLIAHLLQDGYFSEELLQILHIIANNQCRTYLIKAISKKSSQKRFFHLLLKGLDNESLYIEKEVSRRFLYSESLSEENMRALEELSIEGLLIGNVSVMIWESKIKILQLMNQFLQYEEYQSNLLQSDVEYILEKLISVYLYSQERGKITAVIQKTISVISYNILMLIEAQFLNETITESQSELVEIQRNPEISNKMREYFCQNTHFAQMIEKTSQISYDSIIELISLMNQISIFSNCKQVDERIIIQGKLISKICQVIKSTQFNADQSGSILKNLLSFMQNLYDKSFNFKTISTQIFQLNTSQINHFLYEQQESLLYEILNQVNKSSQSEI